MASASGSGGCPSNHIGVSVGGANPPRRAQRKVALGQCTLISHGNGRTEANATQANWTLSLVNHCPLLEALGVPGQVEGSGYAVMESVAVDAQVLVTVDSRMLQGLLILKASKMQQEVDLLLMHSRPQPGPSALPAWVLLDLATERHGPDYRRTLRVGVDGRQMSEELNFTRWPGHISLDYALQHNIPTLQALGVEDKPGMQLSVDLHDSGSSSEHSRCVSAGPTSLNYTVSCSHFPGHLELSGQSENDSMALMQGSQARPASAPSCTCTTQLQS